MNRKIKEIRSLEECSIYNTISLFQSKWNIWVLYELSQHKTMRFGELKKSIPSISNTMLTSTLRNLEVLKLIKRVQFNEIPLHVEYSANDSAIALKAVFEAMEKWGNQYLTE